MAAAQLVAIPVDQVNPNTSWVMYARVIGLNNTPITQAIVSAVTFTIHQPTSATAIASGTGSLVKADVIFDTLQTKENDSRWSGTGAGFNFRWSVPPSLSPTAGLTYRYRVKIVCTDGSTFYVVRDRSAIDWGGPSA